jgi:hypothetical protein
LRIVSEALFGIHLKIVPLGVHEVKLGERRRRRDRGGREGEGREKEEG